MSISWLRPNVPFVSRRAVPSSTSFRVFPSFFFTMFVLPSQKPAPCAGRTIRRRPARYPRAISRLYLVYVRGTAEEEGELSRGVAAAAVKRL